MKKKPIALFLPVLIVMSWCTPAFAESQLDYISDEADIFSTSEYLELSERATEVSDAYGCGVYLVVVDDFTDYSSAVDVSGAAREIYFDYDLGIGQEKSGILLLLSMDERDFALYTFGYGNTAFTDFGKDYLEKAFLDDLGEDNCYDACSDYIRVSEEMLQAARDGNPIDANNAPQLPYARVYGVIVCIAIGFLIAFIVRGVLHAQLKSVAYKTQATAFITAEGLQLTDQYDQYTYTTQSRVYDPPKKDRDIGGTTLDSFGGSSDSGKF